MVNHCRTLLLNARRTDHGVPGEEIVPSTFVPSTRLPAAVTKIRKLVFGDSPSRIMLNYRLRQLMPLWHDTELDEFVREYDPRITYWPNERTEFYKTAFTPSVVAPDGGTAFITGYLEPDENSGQIEYKWRLTRTDSTTIRVEQMQPPYTRADNAVIFEGGLSSLFPLTGSSAKGSFSGDVGVSLYLSAAARPERSLGDMLATLKSFVTGSDEVTLFGINPTGKLKTLRDLWKDHHWYGYQMGALMLAVVDTINERR